MCSRMPVHYILYSLRERSLNPHPRGEGEGRTRLGDPDHLDPRIDAVQRREVIEREVGARQGVVLRAHGCPGGPVIGGQRGDRQTCRGFSHDWRRTCMARGNSMSPGGNMTALGYYLQKPVQKIREAAPRLSRLTSGCCRVDAMSRSVSTTSRSPR